MANNQAIRPYYYNLGKEYGLDKNAIDSLLSYNDSTGEVSFGGKNLGKPVSETNGVSYWDKSFLDNEWNNYVKNAGLVKKGAKSENRVGVVEGYKPTSDVNNIYKQKQKWADANAANDIKGQNEAATAVQKFYNSMRENGYGDVADELENTPAGSDYAKKYYNMAGNVAFRDYMYQLGANDGLSKEDVDKLINYNDTTGEVFFGGKNLGKPVGEFDGVSYWNQNDLDNVYKNYMNNGGAQRLTDEQRYNKMAALSDKANEDQYNRLIGQQDKRNDKVYELLDEAYKLPSYENIIKGVMSKYDLAAMQGRDNAAASAAASNGGNIDSYAAANAARQQAALTSEGLAQAHKMGLEAYNARIGNAQSILENLGVQLNNDNTAVRSNIEGINANRQAYFENDETRKNNDVTRKAAMSEVTGYAPKEWVLANNPYFNDDGTLNDKYKNVDFKDVINKAVERGDDDLAEYARQARYVKIMGDYGNLGQYDDGDYSVPGKQQTEAARQFDKQIDSAVAMNQYSIDADVAMNDANNAAALASAAMEAEASNSSSGSGYKKSSSSNSSNSGGGEFTINSSNISENAQRWIEWANTANKEFEITKSGLKYVGASGFDHQVGLVKALLNDGNLSSDEKGYICGLFSNDVVNAAGGAASNEMNGLVAELKQMKMTPSYTATQQLSNFNKAHPNLSAEQFKEIARAAGYTDDELGAYDVSPYK